MDQLHTFLNKSSSRFVVVDLCAALVALLDVEEASLHSLFHVLFCIFCCNFGGAFNDPVEWD